MIPNCIGCKWEFEEAYRQQEEAGLHVATCPDFPNSYPVRKGHYCMIIVDNKGKLRMW
jgi:hypothetical protein